MEYKTSKDSIDSNVPYLDILDLDILSVEVARIFQDNDNADEIKSAVFGKNGLFAQATESVKLLSTEIRGDVFKKITKMKDDFMLSYNQRFNPIKIEQLDVTLPTESTSGKLHIISHTISIVRNIMISNGFAEVDAPCIENEETNFDALNMHKNHPARGSHDTFYMNSGNLHPENLLLRTHTTNAQIRTLQIHKYEPPFSIFHIGRTYRRDDDSTHSPMFHQVDSLYVDQKVTFAQVKSFIKTFLETFFERSDLKIRYRPSYFPFTEPSLEVDVLCYRENGIMSLDHGNISEWMEILGAGIVRQNILTRYNYNNVRGFAFGIGIERIAMLKYGINSITDLYKNKYPFLHNFSIDAHKFGRLS